MVVVVCLRDSFLSSHAIKQKASTRSIVYMAGMVRHLPARSRQWARSNMIWGLLEAGNGDTRMT